MVSIVLFVIIIIIIIIRFFCFIFFFSPLLRPCIFHIIMTMILSLASLTIMLMFKTQAQEQTKEK